MYACDCYVILSLGNDMIYIDSLMNADQIYTYLMKLKLNLHIGPNSNYKRLYMVTKIKAFNCLKKYSFICWKTVPSPARKQNGLAVPN